MLTNNKLFDKIKENYRSTFDKEVKEAEAFISKYIEPHLLTRASNGSLSTRFVFKLKMSASYTRGNYMYPDGYIPPSQVENYQMFVHDYGTSADIPIKVDESLSKYDIENVFRHLTQIGFNGDYVVKERMLPDEQERITVTLNYPEVKKTLYDEYLFATRTTLMPSTQEEEVKV